MRLQVLAFGEVFSLASDMPKILMRRKKLLEIFRMVILSCFFQKLSAVYQSIVIRGQFGFLCQIVDCLCEKQVQCVFSWTILPPQMPQVCFRIQSWHKQILFVMMDLLIKASARKEGVDVESQHDQAADEF